MKRKHKKTGSYLERVQRSRSVQADLLTARANDLTPAPERTVRFENRWRRIFFPAVCKKTGKDIMLPKWIEETVRIEL